MTEEEKVVTTLRLPPGLHESLRQEAFDKRVSINQEIIDRLSTHEALSGEIARLICKLKKEKRS